MFTRNALGFAVSALVVVGAGFGLGGCSSARQGTALKPTDTVVAANDTKKGDVVTTFFKDTFSGSTTAPEQYIDMRAEAGTKIMDSSKKGFTSPQACEIQNGNKITLADGSMVDGKVFDTFGKVTIGSGKQAFDDAKAQIDVVKRAQLNLDLQAVNVEIGVINGILDEYRGIAKDPTNDAQTVADAKAQVDIYTGLLNSYQARANALNSALSDTTVKYGNSGLTTEMLVTQYRGSKAGGSDTLAGK